MPRCVRVLCRDGLCIAMAVVALTSLQSVDAQDLELGEYLAQECASCHQSQTHVDGIPPIRGLEEEEFLEALRDYRDGFRENQAMEMVARSLSEEDMAALAAWYAAHKDE